MPPSKTKDAWFREKVGRLLSRSPTSISDENVLFPAQPWTPLKLFVLDWYIPLYLNVLRPYYRHLVFVDLFAGSGACIYDRDGIRQVIPGSSLVAASYKKGFPGQGTRASFDRLVTCELLPQRSVLLSEIVAGQGYTTTEYVGLQGSSVDKLPSILRGIPRANAHVLVFADPEDLDGMPFQLIQRILRAHPATDFLVNHLVAGAARAGSSSAFKAFYDGRANESMSREQLSDLYFEMMRELLPVAERMRVRAGSEAAGYYYELILATRQTHGNNPWSQDFSKLKDTIETFTGDEVDHVMRTLVPVKSGTKKSLQSTLG